MKWLSKIFTGGESGRGGATGGEQPQFLGDENMVWLAPTRSMVQSIIFSPDYAMQGSIERGKEKTFAVLQE